MFIVICMVITAPINKDMIITRGIESTPSLLISKTRRLKNSFHLSGTLNTWEMKMQYLPKEATELINIILTGNKKYPLTEKQS